MEERKRENIFVSDCGNFVAIRVPGPDYQTFDVWRHDGSEMWIGERYIQAPGSMEYTPKSMHTDPHARSTKIVGSWSNRGHRKRDDTWIEGFELLLHDLYTGKSYYALFHTSIASLTPLYTSRRQKKHTQNDESE